MRQLIRNGKIYDGTGSEPFTGDILIDQDRIAGIGEQIRKAVPDQEKSFGIEKVMINGQLYCRGGTVRRYHNALLYLQRNGEMTICPGTGS